MSLKRVLRVGTIVEGMEDGTDQSHGIGLLSLRKQHTFVMGSVCTVSQGRLEK